MTSHAAALTCLAVGADGAGWAAAAAGVRLVDADARGVAERCAVSALLGVAETRDLIVDVALAEMTLAVPLERSS